MLSPSTELVLEDTFHLPELLKYVQKKMAKQQPQNVSHFLNFFPSFRQIIGKIQEDTCIWSMSLKGNGHNYQIYVIKPAIIYTVGIIT